MKVIYRGAVGSTQLREFYCNACRAYFDAFSKSDADGNFEPRTHSCGALCGIAKVPSRAPTIRGGEWNSVPADHRKAWQKYWGLTDDQARKVTREEMDRVCREKNISFADATDVTLSRAHRPRGGPEDLPPETEDARAIEEWNAKKYGDDFVREQKQQIRAVFDAAVSGTLEKLPEAEDTNAHDTPHVIDVEKVQQDIAAAEIGPQIEVVSR